MPILEQAEDIDHHLSLLHNLVLKILERRESSSTLRKEFGDLFKQGYHDGLQLPRAYFALIAHLLQLDPLPVQPVQLPNGVALLDTFGWCTSREAPEPTELAELGVVWMILGVCLKEELLQRAGLKIATWQVHLLDAQGTPHLSLWSCARSFRPSLLSIWNHVLFTMAYRLTGQNGFAQIADICRQQAWNPNAFALQLLSLIPPTEFSGLYQNHRPFAEEMTVGIMKFSTPESSFMAHLSGWNSGLFSFHKKEVALVNGGPQVGHYDDLSQFGIYRTCRRHFQEIFWEKTAYHCHLKGWTRLTAIPLWIELDARLQAGQVTIEIALQEKNIEISEEVAKLRFGAKSALFGQDPASAQIAYSKSSMSICAETGPAQNSSNLASKASLATPSSLSMILFLKCPKLIIGGKHHLKSTALDRYEGRAQSLELQGSQEKMTLHPDPALKMQVLPLAGGDYFWGADFLVAFPSFQESKLFRLEIK